MAVLFGEKIKNLRKEKGISQEKLAEALGVTRRSILNYETKSIYPKNSTIIGKMAEIFGVTTDYLLSDSEQDIQTEVDKILKNTAALFAGGTLSEEDKIAFVNQIRKIYLDSEI